MRALRIQPEIAALSGSLVDEIVSASGLPRTAFWHNLFLKLLHHATDNLAHIAITFDHLAGLHGLPRAAELSLSNWCRSLSVRGQEQLPPTGPLLVVSNHPGVYDALVVASRLPRPDLRLIASDLPFLHSLQNISQRIFFIPINKGETYQRMGGMLSALRYLKAGGAVLLMGSGTIDPDPAVYPGALAHLQRWTEAVTLFLRFVPRTQVLLSAVSHIVSPKWAHHPLTWLAHAGLGKRRLAEVGQVLQQLFLPGSLYLEPCLSFSPILAASDLGDAPREALIQREASLLAEHCQEYGGFLT